MVSAAQKVEECDVDGARAEGCKLEVVWNDILVIRRMPALQGQSVRLLAVLLVRLRLPREEKRHAARLCRQYKAVQAWM